MQITKRKCYEGLGARFLATPELIARNGFKLARSPEEIADRMKAEMDLPLSFVPEVLFAYTPVATIMDRLKPEVRKQYESGEKKPWRIIDSVQETAQDMLDYLSFGYTKAIDERGISAFRTIEKLSTWLWLLGRDDLVRLVRDDVLYDPYGAPALVALTRQLGLKPPDQIVSFAESKY